MLHGRASESWLPILAARSRERTHNGRSDSVECFEDWISSRSRRRLGVCCSVVPRPCRPAPTHAQFDGSSPWPPLVKSGT
eukprot:720791-Amphidinium_carterae.1